MTPGTGADRPGLPATTSRRGLLTGLAVGLPIVAFGLRGVVVDADRTRPAELARWIVGAAAVHDLVLVPAVLAVAWVARRITPATIWPAVRAGMATTGALALVAWPFVRGYGRDPANPSLLPRDHATGLAFFVAAVWATTAVWAAALAVRARRTTRRRGPG